MNATPNGRWGRYRTIHGEKHKLCNGPLHDEGGAFLPMKDYHFFKKGRRKGQPFSRCAACERVYRGLEAQGGLIPVDRVSFVFEELKRRIGKAETCRRLGVSHNLWIRLDNAVYKSMSRMTARKAIQLLVELRANDVVFHRDSIRHGALVRGREVKVPESRRDYYVQQWDAETHQARRRRVSLSSS